LFLFGSYMDNPKEANDIDLLIVYDKKNLSIDNVLNERKSLKEIIHFELNLPVEICILNNEEYEEDNMMKYIKKKELK
jgi:predicted nucleotidyltransferase